MRAKPTITDTTMIAIFHGSIRLVALSIWIAICLEENNMEKLNSITKIIVHPEPNHIWHNLAQLTNLTDEVGWEGPLDPVGLTFCSNQVPSNQVPL